MSALQEESNYTAEFHCLVDVIAFKVLNGATSVFRITWADRSSEAVVIIPKFCVTAFLQDDRRLLSLHPLMKNFAPLPLYEQQYPDLMYTLASNLDEQIGPNSGCYVVSAIDRQISRTARLVDILFWIQDSITMYNDSHVLAKLQFQARETRNIGPAIAQTEQWRLSVQADHADLQKREKAGEFRYSQRKELTRELKLLQRNHNMLVKCQDQLTRHKTPTLDWAREHMAVTVEFGGDAIMNLQHHEPFFDFETEHCSAPIRLTRFQYKGVFRTLGSYVASKVLHAKEADMTEAFKAMVYPGTPSVFPPVAYSEAQVAEEEEQEPSTGVTDPTSDDQAPVYGYPVDKKG